MHVADAQREVRTIYLNGSLGELVSGLIWLGSAALATWGSPRLGILALTVGGAFIFPATQIVLRLAGRKASLSPENPLRHLAMQVAFTIPLALPLIGAATLHRAEWFYPAFMVVVGAHYLPFVFLYGMRLYAVQAGAMVASGTWLGMTGAGGFAAGGWLTGVLMLASAAFALLRPDAPRTAILTADSASRL